MTTPITIAEFRKRYGDVVKAAKAIESAVATFRAAVRALPRPSEIARRPSWFPYRQHLFNDLAQLPGTVNLIPGIIAALRVRLDLDPDPTPETTAEVIATTAITAPEIPEITAITAITKITLH